jgi:cytochrome b subunit of formate dehydrogenase
MTNNTMTTKKKKPNKARINYYVDIIIAISFVLVALSGVILFFAGSGGYQGGRNPRYAQEVLGVSRLLWKDLHNWGGIIMMGGALLHLVLHWKWIVCMTRNLFKRPAADRVKLAKPASVKSCPVEG